MGGGISIVDWQNPALSSPHPTLFPRATVDRCGVFPTRRSTVGRRAPPLRPSSGEGAGSATLSPGWMKAAPRGSTDFLAATRGAAATIAIWERRPGEMGVLGLSVMNVVPWLLVRYLSQTSMRPIFLLL